MLEDEILVRHLFSSFHVKKNRVLSWSEFQHTMSVYYDLKNYGSKLEVGFRFFDSDGKGFIKREEMATLLPLLCHSLQQVHADIPHPFNCREGVIQWVQTAYSELDAQLEPMRRKQFVAMAKSAPWAMALLTLGGYLPKDHKSHQSLPDLQKRQMLPPTDKAPSPPTEKASHSEEEQIKQLQKELHESRQREHALQARVDELILKNSAPTNEEDDEWTDSDNEQEGDNPPEELLESVQEQNDRLVRQVRALQAELKKQISACNKLRQEKRELIDKNDSLRSAVGKLQQQQQCTTTESPRACFSPKKESTSASFYSVASIPDQIDSYHAYLSWTFQKERIVQPPTSDEIPIPPSNVQKVDVLMKRGDFVHSWKKRLAIATDRAVYYYSEPVRPKGSIELRNVRGVREADSTQPPLTLEILTPDRVWALSFSSKIQLQAWYDLLHSAAQENTRRLQLIKEKREQQASAAAKRAEERRRMEAPLSRANDRLWSF